MGTIIALAINVIQAVASAAPAMAKAFVDVRQALRETARAGKKHVHKAVSVGKRKYQVKRNRYERAKRRHS